MTDIRKYLNIVNEALAPKMMKPEDWIVKDMKEILTDPSDDGSNQYNVYDILEYSASKAIAAGEVGEEVYDFIKPSIASKLFKQATGMTPAKFCDNYHREEDKKAMAAMDPLSKKIWKLLSDRMITTLTSRDAKILQWYKYSPKKIVVYAPDNTGLPLAVIGDVALGQLKITMQDMINWLAKNNIRQVKKPKAYKSAPPYYD